LTSALCDVQSYSDLDSDSLGSLYDSTITKLLDRQVRRLERAARREGPLSSLHVADCYKSYKNVTAESLEI